jgi:hypothetical protein
LSAKRRHLDVAKIVADAKRGFVDDSSGAHPRYRQVPAAAGAEGSAASARRGGSSRSHRTTQGW